MIQMQSANNEIEGGEQQDQCQPNKGPAQQLWRPHTMKASFVFLVNTSPFNVTAYSLRKTKKAKWSGGWACFCRGYLLRCLATTGLKVYGHWKALQLCSYWVCLSTDQQNSTAVTTRVLGGALIIQKKQNVLAVIPLWRTHKDNPITFA